MVAKGDAIREGLNVSFPELKRTLGSYKVYWCSLFWLARQLDPAALLG